MWSAEDLQAVGLVNGSFIAAFAVVFGIIKIVQFFIAVAGR